MRDVILHAFDWPFDLISEHAEGIASAGYGAVLISPPLYSRDGELGLAWWNRYQPKDYRLIRSKLGNKASLEMAIARLHQFGVRIYGDMVFNHMANEERPDHFDFPGSEELRRYREQRADFEKDRLYGNLDEPLFDPRDFNAHGNIMNWLDRHETTEHSLSGLPDLDMTPHVVEQQRLCLRALNAMGFDGYRVDAVKHLPEYHIRMVFETRDMVGKYVFGESLTFNDQEEGLFLWPLLDRTAMAYYDFPLYGTLRQAFSPHGSMRELVDPTAHRQALPWSKAVTFSVTHDIPNNAEFRSALLSRQDEFLANVYLLGRDGGRPLVFSDLNQSAEAYPDDRDRWANAWNRADTLAMIRFHNALFMAPQRMLVEEDCFLVFSRGEQGIVAINKSDAWQAATFATDELQLGLYRCQLHGFELQLEADRFTLIIPPRQAQMWLKS